MPKEELITFAVICYKQEAYIEDAVRSALLQKYEPLEIVISDDCSPDLTFSIVERLVSEYKGPHKIIINRNKVNIGLAGNINKVWELSSAEFLVIQAGDDISVPERTLKLVEARNATVPKPDLLYSDLIDIDQNGNKLGYRNEMRDVIANKFIADTIKGKNSFVVGGCSAAYSRSIHEITGDLFEDVIAEDFVYSFRALLGNGIVGVPEALLMYRQNEDSIIGKLKAGNILEKRMLTGELAKLLEYKKAVNAYKKNTLCNNFILDRRIKSARMEVKSLDAKIPSIAGLGIYAFLTMRFSLCFRLIKRIIKKILY